MIGKEVIAVYGDAGDGEELFEVQKLVRCAECKHCKLDVVVERRVSGYERSINICHHPRYLLELAVDKDWYCADGERKENK